MRKKDRVEVTLPGGPREYVPTRPIAEKPTAPVRGKWLHEVDELAESLAQNCARLDAIKVEMLSIEERAVWARSLEDSLGRLRKFVSRLKLGG